MNELVPSISIENIVQKRDAAIERAERVVALLEEMRGLGFPTELIYSYSRSSREEFSVETARRHIDSATWQTLLTESGLYTFFDAEAREKWRKAIDSGDVPEVTVANIEATFASLYDKRGEMFERGVIAIFKSLSWDYKSNKPCLFDKKIVRTYSVDVMGGWQYASVSHRASNEIDDLMRVFCLLDGKPEPDHRQGAWRVLHDAQWPRQDPVYEFPYFTVRGFKNGNIHITFTRQDLVTQMNKIIAKHYPGALPRAAT